MSNLEPTESFPDGVTLAKVGGAYLELQDHNSSHTGIGAGIGGLIGTLVQVSNDVISDDPTPPDEVHDQVGELGVTSMIDSSLQENVAVGGISEDLLSLTVDPVFDAVGLARWDGQSVTDGRVAATNNRQGLVIVNPNRFEDLLKQAAGKLEEHPELKDLIKDAYNNLLFTIRRLATAESVQGEEELYSRVLVERLDVLGKIQSIITGFVNSDGINLQLGQGTAFLNWGRKPEFKDFLIMRDLGIKEAGTYSPADWHKDTSGPKYEHKWHNLLQHYEKVAGKYGPGSDLVVLMKAEIEDTLSNPIVWPESRTAEYVNSIEEARKKVLLEARDMGLLSESHR